MPAYGNGANRVPDDLPGWIDFVSSAYLGAVILTAVAAVAIAVTSWFVIKWQAELQQQKDEAFETYKVHEAVKIADLEKATADANVRAAEANQKAEEERLARIKIEARLAPRLLSQAQQNALKDKLSGVDKQRGAVVASPSTPESEWFARVLTAPLLAAGWEMEISPGTATATFLQPTGVIVQYAFDSVRPIQEQPERASAANRLADALKELGIDATALPGLLSPPRTIEITISTK